MLNVGLMVCTLIVGNLVPSNCKTIHKLHEWSKNNFTDKECYLKAEGMSRKFIKNNPQWSVHGFRCVLQQKGAPGA